MNVLELDFQKVLHQSLQIGLEFMEVGRKKASKSTNKARALNSTLILPLKTMHRVFRLKDLHTSLSALVTGIPPSHRIPL